MRAGRAVADPTKHGDRRKHDKRDAIQLARLYRAGELTTVHIPTESEERRTPSGCKHSLPGQLGEPRAGRPLDETLAD